MLGYSQVINMTFPLAVPEGYKINQILCAILSKCILWFDT